MYLLAVIIVFFIVQQRSDISLLQNDFWLDRSFDYLQARGVNTSNAAWLIIVFIPVTAQYFLYLLGDNLLGIPQFIGIVLMLLYSLGRGNFSAHVDEYLAHWQQGDLQAAYHRAEKFPGDIKRPLEVEDAGALHRYVVQGILYQGFERWFSVLFWFALAGPLGALVFRLTQLLQARLMNTHGSLSRFLQYLEWPPLQLLAFSFALAGDFTSGIRAWQTAGSGVGPDYAQRLMKYALASLGSEAQLSCQVDSDDFLQRGSDQIRDLMDLQQRSLLIWLVIMAVLILLVLT